MSKKKTVFYIWGYGSSPEADTIKYLEYELGNDYNVISDYYAQYNPKEALFDLKELVKANNVDLIVASSLGGYLAMQLTGTPKVIINPCVRPDIELPLLMQDAQKVDEKTGEALFDDDGNPVIERVPAVPEHIVKYYTEYVGANDVWSNFTETEKEHTIFVLANNDEVLGNRYDEDVNAHTDNVVISEQGHKNTPQSIHTFVVPAIKKLIG